MTTFKINKEKTDAPEIYAEVYTFWGNHDYEDDNGFPLLELNDEEIFDNYDAFAIKMTKGEKITYYVKRGRYGKLFNPIGMYSEGRAKKQMRHAGKPEWTFEPTNEKIFQYYITFLKTKNAAWLNNAEREI